MRLCESKAGAETKKAGEERAGANLREPSWLGIIFGTRRIEQLRSRNSASRILTLIQYGKGAKKSRMNNWRALSEALVHDIPRYPRHMQDLRPSGCAAPWADH
jgi:hypothetical protein